MSSASVTELLDRLAELGSTDAIAAHLFAAGAFGEPRRAKRCPLSLYVLRQTGVQVYVGNCAWSTLDRQSSEDALLPPLVGQFVWRFDIGLYPELDLGRPAARGRFMGEVAE